MTGTDVAARATETNPLRWVLARPGVRSTATGRPVDRTTAATARARPASSGPACSGQSGRVQGSMSRCTPVNRGSTRARRAHAWASAGSRAHPTSPPRALTRTPCAVKAAVVARTASVGPCHGTLTKASRMPRARAKRASASASGGSVSGTQTQAAFAAGVVSGPTGRTAMARDIVPVRPRHTPLSEVHHVAGDAVQRLHDGLAQGGVGEDDPGELVGGQVPGLRGVEDRQQLGDVG